MSSDGNVRKIDREKRKSRLGKFKEKRLSYMPNQSKRRESTFSTTVLREDGSQSQRTPQSQPALFGGEGGVKKSQTTFSLRVQDGERERVEPRPAAGSNSARESETVAASPSSSNLKKEAEDEARPIDYGVAQWEFNHTNSNEISMAKGELVEVLKNDDDDWLLIRIDDNEGYVPKAYVKIIVEPAPAPAPSSPSLSPVSNGRTSASSPAGSPLSPAASPGSVPGELSLFEEEQIGDASDFLGEDADPQDVQRFKIAKEILATEASYLHSLSQLVDIYKNDFVNFSVDPNNELSQEEITKIFSNVESIRSLSQNLKENLTEKLKSWSSVQTIGEIFIKIAPILIIYTEYANGYEIGLNLFKEKRRSNKHLEHVHGECKKRAGFDLDHYLIMPVQRIPRYNLLLGDLLKNTNDDHPDYQNLTEGLAACQRIATNINDCMRQSEKVKEMSDLVEKNALFGSLLQADRQLKVQQHSLVTRINLVDGQVDGAVEKEREKERERAMRGKDRGEKGLVLVFNDLFVYATKKSLASPDPIANSFVVPLNLVWYLGSDGVSCNVVIPGFFLSIIPDDKKETNIRTKLSDAVEKNVLQHLKGFWGQTMQTEYTSLMDKVGSEWKATKTVVSEEKKDPEKVGDEAPEGASLEEQLGVIDANISKLKQMLENPQENPVQALLGEIMGDLKKGMGAAAEDPVMRSQFEDRITVIMLLKKQIPKMKAKPAPKKPKVESPAMVAKRIRQQELIKFEEGKLCKEDLSTAFPYRYGRFTHPEKGEYEGWWRGGLAHRLGELKFQGNHYEGEFVHGFLQGKGACEYFNGAKYTGKWERNMANGAGVFTSEYGDTYEGAFYNNLKQGKGQIMYINGDKYSGEWKNDLPNGTGLLFLSCGLHYYGGFKDGLFEGEGELLAPSGKKYKGSWVRGMREGKGVMQESDGATYAGEWHQNCFHGLGTYNNPSDGTFYAGEWVKGQKEGEGLQVYHNGDIYSGQFRMSTRLGRGCCEFSNEDFYLGQWKNDMFHGKGAWRKGNGVKFHGAFVEGQFDGVVQTSSGAKTIKPAMASQAIPHFHTFQTIDF